MAGRYISEPWKSIYGNLCWSSKCTREPVCTPDRRRKQADVHGRVEQGRTPKSGNLPTMTWISLAASNGRATATRTKVLLFTSPSRTPGWFVCTRSSPDILALSPSIISSCVNLQGIVLPADASGGTFNDVCFTAAPFRLRVAGGTCTTRHSDFADAVTNGNHAG